MKNLNAFRLLAMAGLALSGSGCQTLERAAEDLRNFRDTSVGVEVGDERAGAWANVTIDVGTTVIGGRGN